MFENAVPNTPQVLGLIGFLIYAATDILQSLNRISSSSLAYYASCLAALSLVALNLVLDFNLRLLLAELFCLATCMLAVFVLLRSRKQTSHRNSVQTLAEVRFP